MNRIFLWLSLSLGMLATASCGGGTKTTDPLVYEPVAPTFCEDSAYAYVEKQCSFGPRTMNSEAHAMCGEWIAEKFRSFGATTIIQSAESKLYDGTVVSMQNIIASMNPSATVRVIISGHWDSRPWADNDPDESNHHTPIDGANDGGSSIGVMLEIARQMALQGDTCGVKVGIDFICWDAEDCGTPKFDDNAGIDNANTWCLGSQYWSDNRHAEGYRARWGMNLDMVGGNNSQFKKEAYSMHYAPSYVDRIWSTARKLGYDNYFVNEDGGGVTDDHVQVNISGIPCVDIIANKSDDFGFPETWHTVNDNISNISKNTLKAVGQTVMEVIWNEQ